MDVLAAELKIVRKTSLFQMEAEILALLEQTSTGIYSHYSYYFFLLFFYYYFFAIIRIIIIIIF